MMHTHSNIYGIHPPSIWQALELYLEPGQVTELRALNARISGEYGTGTFSGYFNREHITELIAACERIEFATGVYFVPNPVKPEAYARRCNRAELIRGKEPITSDKDILKRGWLLIDCDPCRASGISSTDEEKQQAHEMLVNIDCELWQRGFPPGIIADSGNGYHLTIPCDMPADDGGKVERFLKGLAKQFDNEHCKVDTTVHNPARIWKLPGTLSCKGDHCPQLGRPWRQAKIIRVCEEVPSNA
jgi:hypothetical protein